MKEHNKENYWDKHTKIHSEKFKNQISWLDSPTVIFEHLLKLKSKEKKFSVVDYVSWVKEKYVKDRLDLGLSVGCGDGTLERHAIKIGICSRFESYDLSSKSVEIAQKINKEQGLDKEITCFVRDMNTIRLPKNRFDIIFCGMSLHHIKQLKHVYAEFYKSLKPKGLLVFNEYVGPNQFQWTKKQTEIINELLSILPEKYKKDVRSNAIRYSFEGPSIGYMNEHDPSEAVCSEGIIPLLQERFDIIEKVDYGGNVLHMLLDGIIANFDPEKEEDKAILKLLCYIDWLLIEENAMQSDFCVVVAKRKKEKKSLYSKFFG